MPTNTYVALDKVTLTSNASDVTFSSIPSGYTDLVVVVMGASTTAGSSTNGLRWQINGDTGANYSETQLLGDGTSATSSRTTSATDIGAGLLMQTSAGYFATNIIHFMNYSNTTTYKTMLTRPGAASVSTAANVSLWRSTSAITSIKFYRLTDQLKAGSTFSLYGIAAVGVSPAPKATGGAIYSDSLYYYHVFGSTGTFTPLSSLSCDVLAIGGGGGTSAASGGGGAGGVIYAASQSLTATGYTVTVGAGGALSASGGVGNKGTNTTFGGLVTANAGGAGTRTGGSVANGGSGGGVAAGSSAGTASAGSGGTGYANAGGVAVSPTPNGYGGGGGAGAAGGANAGGNGTTLFSSWGLATGTGQNVSGTYYYAGGGSGPSDATNPGPSVAGGLGGGGASGNRSTGTATAGTAGAINTGSGAGGGGIGNSVDGSGAAGGSGIVIVRYAK